MCRSASNALGFHLAYFLLLLSAPLHRVSGQPFPVIEVAPADSTLFSGVRVFSESHLRAAPDPDSHTIVTIPQLSLVEVYAENFDGYVMVRYDGQIGYVHYLKFDRQSVPWQLVSQFVTERDDSQKSSLQRKFGRVTTARILRSETWRGMTAEMVLESIGRPTLVTTITERGLTREEWTYERRLLVIKAGKLARVIETD